ncbi:endo alpha-1,4 polygalactosaminidase [Reinekea blandensis]|uniref:Putative endo alpha-1,4 polygalactosaminidase precusor n=1 Tax=Reinekea blandensis MED297 TaxID=314283 RepID=A4BAW9_9GAMM|nr:endo alpha-1,4 polygalactosaminidase [Reinekea blandensis]EAR10582.1 putative endo alpha-1,4 polygalactosaminidase precusor [Reinekea sp. MED297] [Reinekea blandensis MED297]
MLKPALLYPIVLTLMLSACQFELSAPSASERPDNTPTRYAPEPGITWHWQLNGTLNTDYDVDLYDVDLFDTPKSTIAALQAEGIAVICYFSAGSYEHWRSDASDFPAEALGLNMDGWADERWLDVRSARVRAIMVERLKLAQEKGCDGVEPDNVDGFDNATGFPLMASDQLSYNRFLAAQAHTLDLAIGLKNDLGQIEQLVDTFDFAVNEECFEYNECDSLKPFIQAGKAVLNAEYSAYLYTSEYGRTQLCNQARELRFSTLILPLDLDDSLRFDC